MFFPPFIPFHVAFDSLPPVRYKETMNTILLWIQQSEAKLSTPQVTVTEYEIMEQRLKELKVGRESMTILFYISNGLLDLVKEITELFWEISNCSTLWINF